MSCWWLLGRSIGSWESDLHTQAQSMIPCRRNRKIPCKAVELPPTVIELHLTHFISSTAHPLLFLVSIPLAAEDCFDALQSKHADVLSTADVLEQREKHCWVEYPGISQQQAVPQAVDIVWRLLLYSTRSLGLVSGGWIHNKAAAAFPGICSQLLRRYLRSTIGTWTSASSLHHVDAFLVMGL